MKILQKKYNQIKKQFSAIKANKIIKNSFSHQLKLKDNYCGFNDLLFVILYREIQNKNNQRNRKIKQKN